MIAHTYAYISSRCRSCPTQRALSRCFTSKKKKCRSCPYNKLLFRMQNIKRRKNSLGYEGKNMGNACTLMIMILICIIFLFRNHDLLFFPHKCLCMRRLQESSATNILKKLLVCLPSTFPWSICFYLCFDLLFPSLPNNVNHTFVFFYVYYILNFFYSLLILSILH